MQITVKAPLYGNLTMLYVSPPPKKLLLLAITISELAPENVRLVVVERNQVPLHVTVDVPSVIDLVLLLLEEKTAQVSEKLAVLNVPSVTVKLPHVRLLPRVVVDAPVVFTVTAPVDSDTPFVVMVEVIDEARISSPVRVYVRLEEGKVRFPRTSSVPEPARVMAPSRPLTVMLRQMAPVLVVTVKEPVPTFELASKNTSSALVGADAPLAPPELDDQLVVDELFQLPVPPTQ